MDEWNSLVTSNSDSKSKESLMQYNCLKRNALTVKKWKSSHIHYFTSNENEKNTSKPLFITAVKYQTANVRGVKWS